MQILTTIFFFFFYTFSFVFFIPHFSLNHRVLYDSRQSHAVLWGISNQISQTMTMVVSGASTPTALPHDPAESVQAT